MKLVTAEEMREIDRRTIEDFGVPSLDLMEKAGGGVAQAVAGMLGNLPGKRVVIFAGKGNNGGDGFVAARHLQEKGTKVSLYLLGRKEEVKGDARVNLERLSQLPTEIITVKHTAKGSAEGSRSSAVRQCRFTGSAVRQYPKGNERDLESAKGDISQSHLIIDAILGTGTKGTVDDLLAEAIKLLNATAKPIVSVDIPSGLDADGRGPLGVCVKATKTVTMGLPKRGLVLYPGAEYVGELTIADIGIPQELLGKGKINLLTAEDIRALLPVRREDSHKGDYGHILVLAGSVGLTGAAALTSLGALRSGAGLVTLAVAESLNPIMEVKLTEVMTKPLPETEDGTLSLKAEEKILELVKKIDILAIGPGLSTSEETSELVRRLIVKVEKPMVIDADAVNALSGNISTLKRAPGPRIITPHPGEMARLLGKSREGVQADRIGISQEVAEETGATVVLKGARTIISDSEGSVYVNPTGNPGMASGGVGDILTGMIASFLGQGLGEIEAAQMGVYLHGLAADIAKESKGELALIASDLLDSLPRAIKRLTNNKLA
ncbi:NAD(P)H-hydrate dehydratase [candidate division NPL-UPA2 bacterium]|nr:NAD(P)H-hydrate dehydratase [candidate division NPL-UPA2 bacterium]